MKKESAYDRQVVLQCPTCGGENFESDDSDIVRCVKCERKISKAELQEMNAERIESELNEMRSELLKDAQTDLRKAFKRWK